MACARLRRDCGRFLIGPPPTNQRAPCWPAPRGPNQWGRAPLVRSAAGGSWVSVSPGVASGCSGPASLAQNLLSTWNHRSELPSLHPPSRGRWHLSPGFWGRKVGTEVRHGAHRGFAGLFSTVALRARWETGHGKPAVTDQGMGGREAGILSLRRAQEQTMSYLRAFQSLSQSLDHDGPSGWSVTLLRELYWQADLVHRPGFAPLLPAPLPLRGGSKKRGNPSGQCRHQKLLTITIAGSVN